VRPAACGLRVALPFFAIAVEYSRATAKIHRAMSRAAMPRAAVPGERAHRRSHEQRGK